MEELNHVNQNENKGIHKPDLNDLLDRGDQALMEVIIVIPRTPIVISNTATRLMGGSCVLIAMKSWSILALRPKE